MSDTEPELSSEAEAPPKRDDETSYRIMLVVVIVLGIALVVCFFVVFGTIAYRLMDRGLPDRSTEVVRHTLDVGSDARIVEIEANNDRLYVLIEDDGERAIHVLDADRLTPRAVIAAPSADVGQATE
ncbi:MAG: hypothetical protein AAFX39_03245 [Pseudomonadota bacterium]